VITGGQRRRRWTAEQKRQVVAESMAPGASVPMVARQHGITRGQLYAWRQRMVLSGAVGTPGEATS
jgi:transposase